MKTLFLTSAELTDVLTSIATSNNEQQQTKEYRVGFSENLRTDVLHITGDGETDDVPLTNFISQLNEYYQIHIKSYDVIEVGDIGDGFAFFYK
ncbi:hypothetical protein ACFVS2_20645 [Brevibacillus sp. NPDC058079]|uniref:hypothetical protein n=1 Tax=Brevibacillus sp. NPDC058079 TaxID=3346330 RepID=UPI0036EC0825